ncbi:MAG: AMP-binding protein [archaeon]|nr:AMP-binding protein [archaeon]
MHKGFIVLDFLRRANELSPEVEIIYSEKKKQTYKETYERVLRLSDSLLSKGITKGTVIGVADWNTPKFVELLYASSAIGAVIYPVNIRLPPEQIVQTIRFADVEWLFLSKDFMGLAKQFDSKEKIVGLDTDDARWRYDELITGGVAKEPETRTCGEDPYSILFTSGTTGLPKAVRYSNDKVVHGALSIVYQLGLYNTPAKLGSSDSMMPLIPFYHLWSWGTGFHAPYLGARYVLSGRFDPQSVVQTIINEKVTWINAVPTMMQMILAQNETSSLRGLKALVGGMAIPYNMAKAMSDAEVEFSTIYGGTDMLATSISIVPQGFSVQDRTDYLRATTHAVPFVEVKVVKPDGQEAAVNELGELHVRAPWLPGGYHKDAEKTESSYVDNDWFKTGDLALLTPEKGIKIVDRVKDVIKSGGEWIPSSILESIISEVPNTELAAVLGAPDEKWGERPVALVKAKTGKIVLKEDVLSHLKRAADGGRVKKWWVPDRIIFVDEMPLTSTGKINKVLLRQKVLAEAQ